MLQVRTIGICGKARSGKDTFARMLQQELEGHDDNRIVLVFSLADPLREMLGALLRDLCPPNEHKEQFKYECFHGSRKETPLFGDNPRSSARYMLQTLGTDWGRNMIDEGLWLRHLDARITSSADMASEDGFGELVIIVPDVRFDNEADYLGGGIIKIVRPNAQEVNTHSSENGIDERFLGAVVYNDEGLDELRKAAETVAKEFDDDLPW